MILLFLTQSWSWYTAGIIIGLIVPTLLIIGNKSFGISSSMRHICAACFPTKIPFFQYQWKKEIWNLFFVIGIVIGGAVATYVFPNKESIQISNQLVKELSTHKITNYTQVIPTDIFNFESLFTIKGFLIIVVGSFLVGFGSRYAGGCTSGHAIMGLSTLQIPSLLAVICFMIGGFISANFIIPFLLSLSF